MPSIAIKLNVSKEDQKIINQLLQKAGYPPQRRKFHCTVGFIEKLPDTFAVDFGQQIVDALQNHISSHFPSYKVEKADHLFGHVIAFLPSHESIMALKKVNAWLDEKVKELSEGKWALNSQTCPGNYVPHFTVWRSRCVDNRFKKLEALISVAPPIYELCEAAYVLFP